VDGWLPPSRSVFRGQQHVIPSERWRSQTHHEFPDAAEADF
jgi:hypothetical protein